MRFALVSIAFLASIAIAAPNEFSPADGNGLLLTKRGGCSQGVHVCCGSTSVGCSGNVCKACCNGTCGCFYVRGSTCSSDPSITPCVDVNKPDFALTNGQCIAGRGGSSNNGGSKSNGGSSSNNGGSKNGGSTSPPAQPCNGLRRLFGLC